MKRQVVILAAFVFSCPLADEASAAAVSRQANGEAAKKAETALACYYGLRHPQDFREARRQAALAGGETSGILIEALCLGWGKGGAQDIAHALRLLAPLLLKGEPMAHAAAAIIMGGGRAADSLVPPEIAAEFREELAAIPTCDPAARMENARLALAGLQSRWETDAVACFLSAQLLGSGIGIPKNEARAEELFRRAWQLGCSDAANQLGLLFNEGEPQRRDKAEAVRWFRLSAEAGNAVAKTNLVLFDTALAPTRVRSLMTEAAEAGFDDGMLLLGRELWLGTRFAHDLPAARQWLEKAAACGRREALADLGRMLRDLTANEEERQRGLKLIRKAAIMGQGNAQYYLAFPFLRGDDGVAANPRAGFILAASAADRGVNDACVPLSFAYEKGIGVPKDVKAARKCLEVGVERGSAQAELNFGFFLAHGTDGEPDPAGAFPHFLAAAVLGNCPGAKGEAGSRLLRGEGVAKDAVAGVAWLRLAVAEGDASAMNALGIAGKNGDGLPADPREALKLFRKSAELGFAPAMFNLGNSLLQGMVPPLTRRRLFRGC